MVHPVQPASPLPQFKKITSVTAADMALRSAQASLQAQHWPQAIAHAQRAIQLQPSATAYKLLGDARLHQQQWQAAKIAYQQALTLQPDSAEIHANLGTLAAHQQQWAAALQAFRRSIALKPELATTLQPNLDQLWTQIEQSNALSTFLDQPDQFEAIDHQMLGDRLLKREQVEAAVRCYETAIAIDPTLATAFWNLSLAHKQLGNSDAMMTTYFQALCLQPTWATADEHCKLGNHFLQQEQWQQAIDCYERAIEQDAALVEAHFGRGTALQKTGQLDGAIEGYRRAIELQPNHFWSHQYLGDVLMQLERWQAAVVAYRGAIELDSQFHWSHYNLGEALAKLEQWDGAIEAYCCVTALKPDLTIAHHKLSRFLHKRTKSDLSTALDSYLCLIHHDPHDVENYYGALEIKRDDPDLHVGLANALASQNQLDQAIVFYQSALQLQPDNAEAKLQLHRVVERKKQISETLGFAVHSADYALWLRENMPSPEDLMCMKETATTLRYKPLISIIVPIYNPPEQFLREMIQSVLDQVYSCWELCLADDCSSKPHVRRVLAEYAAKDTRIKVTHRETNGHISAASNSALKLATGEYITLLDHDDLLAPNALYEVVSLLNEHPEADMIYSDEDKVNEQRELLDPYFKPDWCPDFFLSQNYICHLGTYRRTIINQIGGFRLGYEGSQDYDLVLRFTEKTNNIFHIPKILYHWRIHSESAASGGEAKPYAYEAGARALQDALDRRGEKGTILSHPKIPGIYTVRYSINEYKLVSIIIPTRNLGDVLDRCLQSIFEKSTYPNYEVIIIDNGSDEKETLAILANWKQREPERFRCYSLDIPFNYSRLNNYGVSQAKGEYLLFLNNDTEVITPDWIEAMVEQAQRPSVGAVGALLLYPDNTIQHAGVVLGIGGVAGHSHKNFLFDAQGYFRQLLCVSNYSAVTAACLMCRRSVYEKVAGFDETLKVAFNDVDFCLKTKLQGHNNVFLPHITLYHHESKSRGAEDTPEKQERFRQEVETIQSRWRDLINGDPCYSPNLTQEREDFSLKIAVHLEILSVEVLQLNDEFFWAFSIDSPQPGRLNTSLLTVAGWVVGRKAKVVAIEVMCEQRLINRTKMNTLRPDVGEIFSFVSNAAESGFTTVINVLDLPRRSEIFLQAVFEDDTTSIIKKLNLKY